MKCKLKALFIGISISFFIGNIVSNVFLTPEVGLSNFDTWTETACIYYDVSDIEKDEYSEYSIPYHTNLAHSRHSSQNKRIKQTSSSKMGMFAQKGKEYKKYYHLPLYSKSTSGFSSRLTEARLYLISLGRLII